MMRSAGLVVMLLLLTSRAQADESRRRPDLAPTAAAKQVAEAFDAKDEKTIAELANLEIPNPWFVAEMLLLDQRKDAAVAFAAVTTDKDAAALVAYVGGREITAEDRAAWPAIHAVRSARTVEAVQQILATLASVAEKTKGVTRMRAFESWAGGLQALRRFEESLARYDDAARAARDLTWRFGEQVMLTSAGLSAARRSDHDAAFTRWQAALDLARAREDERNINTLLGNIGTLLRRAGRFREAVPMLEEVLRRQAALGARAKPATRGNVLNALGLCHWRLGDLDKAIALMEQAIAVRTEIGHAVGVAGSTENIGSILMEKGDYLAARKKMDEARTVYERLGSIRHLATHLANSGALYLKQDELDKAKAELARAVELSDQAGNRAGAALTLANLAAAHQVGGEIPEALALFEQVLARQEQLGVDLDRASTLGSLGSLHMALGDHEKARVMLEKSLALREPLGDKRGVANVRGNLGLLWYRQHEYAKAAIELERALAVGEEIQDKPGNVARHANLGNAYSRLERHEDAARQLTQSLALATELGNPSAIASAHGALAHARFDREDYPTAREHFERALAKAREAGDPDAVLHHLSGLAQTHQWLGDKRAAVRYAREAVALLGQLASGLAQEQGAMTRERHAPVFETGILSAAQLGDADALCYFLESGRAGTLLEYLGGRDRLRSFILPDALREALAQARGAEAAAARALERAQGRRNLQLVRSRRTKLAEAREAVRGVVQRIQREAKAAAHVLYPEALDTAKIQAALADGDALVLYGVCDPDTVALVLTREAARIVPLGSTEAIAAAVGDLSLTDTSVDPTRALATLAARVVEPLGLGAKTKRLLVSPAGVLSEVPFGLLHDVDVAYLPSGTTADVLAVQREVRGEGVLALGDPVYGSQRAASPILTRAGGTLTPLPGTREEAKAVGTEVLLGKEATEKGLRGTLGTNERWRSVHLACHGLIDAQQPSFCCLALTPDAEDDGFLTCLEVFRMRVPSELVVLSACETARGKVYQTEGMLGLTRAFMLAGSPRVLCSLWKVDDEATRVLMTKFYELWNPASGEGLAPAAALKRAQAFVRDVEKEEVDAEASRKARRTITKKTRPWAHPNYWAAWVLWGLPD